MALLTLLFQVSSEQISSSKPLAFNELEKLTPGYFRHMIDHAELLLDRDSYTSVSTILHALYSKYL
jgi:hypothetical protein